MCLIQRWKGERQVIRWDDVTGRKASVARVVVHGITTSTFYEYRLTTVIGKRLLVDRFVRGLPEIGGFIERETARHLWPRTLTV